jgi:hypothetical protein
MSKSVDAVETDSTASSVAAWTRELPSANGWYWFKFDEDHYTNLPEGANPPQMLWVAQELGGEGKFYANNPAEIFEEYEVEKMRGLWIRVPTPA